jgi:3-deoxy-manno-octulosonate cytidylyltransferase (CMP-KDO synthetase)
VSTGFIVVIPARYASTRLPGKPLKQIAGKPMIQWVYGQARKSGASEVFVATDDDRIVTACKGFGAAVALTSAEHPSGTDRIAELAHRFHWEDDQIVVNVQGDEPLISPLSIAQVARLLAWHPDATIATLAGLVVSDSEFKDPSFVKVVTDRNGWALYFSRAPIPWPRDGGIPVARRHIGLYAYRAAGLKTISAAPPCELELVEKLEQLRALWLGYRIIVADAVEPPSPHVDTEEDLTNIRRLLENASLERSE